MREEQKEQVKQHRSNFSSNFASWPDNAPPPPGGTEIEKQNWEIKMFPSGIIIPPTSGLSSGFGNIHKYKVGVSLRTFSHRF